MKIIVGMSGGVDSAVTAALLKRQGHRVTGVTMSIWRGDGPYKGGDKNGCFGPAQRESIVQARALADIIGIPYFDFDCSKCYEEQVVEYFRHEYLNGRTPNPCIVCNSVVKFGLLPQLARENGVEFDKFATGHYARLHAGENGRMQLFRAKELARDQSYFLCRLSQEQLARHLFPLGEYEKAAVRQMARDFLLPVSEKHDSQDFYTGSLEELLGQPDNIGEIVDDETGKVLGHHRGCWRYTIGQRRGLGVAAKEPLYVVAIDACRNQVRLGRAAAAVHHELEARNFNWVSVTPPQAPFAAALKVRSVQVPVPCQCIPVSDSVCHIDFPGGIAGVAPGQAAVLYAGDMLLGGGVIARAG